MAGGGPRGNAGAANHHKEDSVPADRGGRRSAIALEAESASPSVGVPSPRLHWPDLHLDCGRATSGGLLRLAERAPPARMVPRLRPGIQPFLAGKAPPRRPY